MYEPEFRTSRRTCSCPRYINHLSDEEGIWFTPGSADWIAATVVLNVEAREKKVSPDLIV